MASNYALKLNDLKTRSADVDARRRDMHRVVELHIDSKLSAGDTVYLKVLHNQFPQYEPILLFEAVSQSFSLNFECDADLMRLAVHRRKEPSAAAVPAAAAAGTAAVPIRATPVAVAGAQEQQQQGQKRACPTSAEEGAAAQPAASKARTSPPNEPTGQTPAPAPALHFGATEATRKERTRFVVCDVVLPQNLSAGDCIKVAVAGEGLFSLVVPESIKQRGPTDTLRATVPLHASNPIDDVLLVRSMRVTSLNSASVGVQTARITLVSSSGTTATRPAAPTTDTEAVAEMLATMAAAVPPPAAAPAPAAPPAAAPAAAAPPAAAPAAAARPAAPAAGDPFNFPACYKPPIGGAHGPFRTGVNFQDYAEPFVPGHTVVPLTIERAANRQRKCRHSHAHIPRLAHTIPRDAWQFVQRARNGQYRSGRCLKCLTFNELSYIVNSYSTTPSTLSDYEHHRLSTELTDLYETKKQEQVDARERAKKGAEAGSSAPPPVDDDDDAVQITGGRSFEERDEELRKQAICLDD